MTEVAGSISVVALFLHADVVVKSVLVLLLAASIWSWAVIIDKLVRLGVARRSIGAHEARAAAAHNTSLAVVAPGIAEALFATAMGLAAAIPAVVAYNKFTVDLSRIAGRVQRLIGRSGGLLVRPSET
jgi:biopolymer transport protein ExbB/TolQ